MPTLMEMTYAVFLEQKRALFCKAGVPPRLTALLCIKRFLLGPGVCTNTFRGQTWKLGLRVLVISLF